MPYGDTDMGGEGRAFPTTRWSRILQARAGPEARREALHALLSAYWKPLYVHARRSGLPSEAAKDAVQSLAARLLERDALAGLDPSRGRLRAYLKAALENLLANERERDGARKRGGGRRVLSLDAPAAGATPDGDGEGAALAALVAGAPSDPHAAFDRAWAREIYERALARLAAELAGGKRGGAPDVLLAFLRPGATPPSHEDAARACGKTAEQWKAHLHRLRLRARALVREEVAATLEGDDDEAAVDAEMAELLRCLRS